jgi:hypothetical protein
MLEFLNRSGGMVGLLGNAIKRGALGLIGTGPAQPAGPTNAIRQRLRAADGAAYRLAHERLLSSIEDRIAAYEPGIQQKDLDAANWKTPVAVHHVLKPEVERIRQYAWDSLRALGFPIDTEFDDLRVEMEKSAKHIIWHLHQKAFVGLRVPGFFQMVNGILDYEMTFDTLTRFGVAPGQWHPVGWRTAHRYNEPFYRGRKPSLHSGH